MPDHENQPPRAAVNFAVSDSQPVIKLAASLLALLDWMESADGTREGGAERLRNILTTFEGETLG
jgi:hypothetical protein